MLTIDGLSKRYGDVQALDSASFVVPPGRIVGFLGPNGAGKTTAMRCVFGLATPDTGEVLWNGRSIGPAERKRFGYMPEERGLYPKMRIFDQIRYFGELSGLSGSEAKKRTEYWLERVGLSDRSKAKLDELSHGNQQRVQLVAALVGDPVLLVLDEPFAGLDPIGIDTMAVLLDDLASSGVGIVFSSHQLDLVEDICEDVVIIDQGQVVLAGSVADLRGSSKQVRVEASVDGAPWVPTSGAYVKSVRDVRGGVFVVSDELRMDDVLSDAAASGRVTSFSYGPPHLSDLFRDAVSHG